MLDYLSRQEKRLEDAFRRHGIEGELAFYTLAFCYAERFRDVLMEPPERIMQRGRSLFDKIKIDMHLTTLLDSIVASDPRGENLPAWYQYFLGRRFREGSGKFFTPKPIASAMARLLPRRERAVIMDPTCGGGTFLIEASKVWGSLPSELVGNDIEPSLVDLAQIVLGLATPKHHRKHFLVSNIYEPTLHFREWYAKVDYILANPPFSLEIDTIDTDSKLFAAGYKNSDALFLDVCFNLLRSQGRLICLLPHSIIANTEFQKLRLLVEESWNLLGVIGMPEGIFHLTANTTTRADIVILEKKREGARHTLEAVFAFAPSVGIPLNSRANDTQINYLDEITNDPEVLDALGIKQRRGP